MNVREKIRQAVAIECIDLVKVEAEVASVTAEFESLVNSNASSEADFNKVKEALETSKAVFADLESEETNLQSELEKLEKEVAEVDAQAKCRGAEVNLKSDLELAEF